jgi:hypothetical protein
MGPRSSSIPRGGAQCSTAEYSGAVRCTVASAASPPQPLAQPQPMLPHPAWPLRTICPPCTCEQRLGLIIGASCQSLQHRVLACIDFFRPQCCRQIPYPLFPLTYRNVRCHVCPLQNPGFDFSGAQFNGMVPDPRVFMGYVSSSDTWAGRSVANFGVCAVA